MSGITPEQRAEWRRDAESDLRGMCSPKGARECDQVLALLDALDAAEVEREMWERQAQNFAVTAQRQVAKLQEAMTRQTELHQEWQANGMNRVIRFERENIRLRDVLAKVRELADDCLSNYGLIYRDVRAEDLLHVLAEAD